MPRLAHGCLCRVNRCHFAPPDPASLQRLLKEVREAGKQEPPEMAISEGSTAPRSVLADGRAASAQSDTTRRR